MRLLNSESEQLEIFHVQPPPYAIISHRWGDESEEVLFTDIGDILRTQSKGKGYVKIQNSCRQATGDGIKYVWLDTCCINKSNSTELGEAINSMYKWYRESEVCYAYLHDVNDHSKFTESDWFTRGWTLQELVAPKSLRFFAKDWALIGTRDQLIDRIAERTGISHDILRSGRIPLETTISQRMVWAAGRETSKVEDMAYSLLGILGVNMVPMYGIDDIAFENLQHRIIERNDDQTLFAWYHNVTQPDDVEMVEVDPATEPEPAPAPEPVPEQGTESVPETTEGHINIPSSIATGLLASSPSQYLKSYEIPEDDFRKNYVDGIREYSYRSNFSIINGFVQISLPMKHVGGEIWKALLRCSLEPPAEGQVQRPLVIYLQETQRKKYVRVHFPPKEEEGDQRDEGDDQADGVEDVPGSLERLNDAELKLEGYRLQEILVAGRCEENPPDDQQPRPTAEDPDAQPEPTENERIARLPRHPPGVKTTNIIVCGEPGVAAGRVINLIMGTTVIKPLADYKREVMAVSPVDATLESRNIRIFYIIGPRDPYLDLDAYYTAIRNMHHLVQHAKESGGIHLMLLCMIGSKVTGAVETNYRLFYDHICQGNVPTMLIVTGLGQMKRMEDWWDKHKADRELQAMCLHDHACITVLQGEDCEHEKKYQESTRTIQRLIINFVRELGTTPEKRFPPDDVDQWFVVMGRRAMDFLLPGQKTAVKQESVVETLKKAKTLKEVKTQKEAKTQKKWVDLTEEEASNLARQFFDEHVMEV